MLAKEKKIIKIAIKTINQNLKKALLLWIIYFDVLLIISTTTIIGVYSRTVVEENPAVKWIFNRNPSEAIVLSLIVNAIYATLYIMVWLISLVLSAMCFKSTSSREFKTMEKISILYPAFTFSMLFLNLMNDISTLFMCKSILGINYLQYQSISILLSITYLSIFYIALIYLKTNSKLG
ncbi:MAG: hypothetical protein NDF54_00135 [archaeon GB-1867-035]|nr:hypothetical protein [Candidatus Culexmicrobium profundum]